MLNRISLFSLVGKNYESQLTGGHHNSLGNTEAVVEQVLEQPESFDELFNCYFSSDEVVRLRVSSAMKRIFKQNKSLLIPYMDRLLNEISKIDQASTQWTLATLFDWASNDLTEDQLQKARQIMKYNLENHNDWIVLNTTMETLTKWSQQDQELRAWLMPQLSRLSEDKRKSVSKRALKFISLLETD